MATHLSSLTFGKTLVQRYQSMGINLATHHKLLSAKAALIKSAIPHPLKMKMANGYRSAEKSLFGRTTTLPGEGELGVQGMGTTFGMRRQIRQAGASEANPSSSSSDGSSDLYQSVLNRLSGEPN